MKLLSLAWLAVLLPFGWIGVEETTASTMFRDETRSVDAFHAIANSGSITVEVRFGDRESVRLTGDSDAIKEIETVAERGTLKIRYKNAVNLRKRNWGKVTAYVTAKRIEELSQSGSGSITVEGNVSGNQLNASVSGSGHITFSSDVTTCNASVSGSGRISAKGQAKSSNVSISGSGRFAGEDFRNQSANVNISGSGSIQIHVDGQLDASVSGSGRIRYSGNAKTNFKKSGSGSLQKI